MSAEPASKASPIAARSRKGASAVSEQPDPGASADASASAVVDLERLWTRLEQGPNPFEPVILPFDRAVEVPDVPTIHGDASDALLALVDEVRRDGEARAILVRGESGTGKTHLLRRAARALGGHALFAAIDPTGAPKRLFRHLLRRAVQELAEPRPGSATALRELAGALLVEGIYALPPDDARERLLDAVLAAPHRFLQRDARLASRLVEACARALAATLADADLDVLRALLEVFQDDLGVLARDWLKGADLDDDELEALRVSRTLADEPDARRALATLAAGARRFRPLVLCFDQTETLWSLGGERVVAALFEAIATLLELPGVCVVYTCLEDVWSSRYEAIAAPLKLFGDREVALARMGPREARAIVAARLEGAFAGLARPYPTWPIPPATLDALVDLSPREVLEHCAREVDGLRERGAREEIAPPGASADRSDRAAPAAAPGARASASGPALSVDSALTQAWVRALAEAERAPDLDEHAFADALLLLLRLALRGAGPLAGAEGMPIIESVEREPQAAGVVVALRDDPELRIVVSDTHNGTSLARLLDKLLAWSGPPGSLRRAALVRLAPEKTSWQVANRRLEELERGGGAVLRPDDATCARLQALRALWGRVLAGEVQNGPRAVDEPSTMRFLARRPELKAALHALLPGPRGGASRRSPAVKREAP